MPKPTRHRFVPSPFHAFVLAAAVAALAGCRGNEAPAGAATADGGTLVIAEPGDPDNLMPPLSMSMAGQAVVDQVFDRLAEIGDQLNTIGDAGFKPQLADRWTWAPDSLSVAFHLDPRARWHDGVPVRARDVRFSLALYKNPKTGSPVAPLLANVDSISTPDSLTAVAWFHHKTPGEFYDIAYQLWVVPQHILDTIPPEKLGTSEAARHPIGSGRFRFVQWQPGSRLEIVADTGNYRGRARLDRVIWAITPDNDAAYAQVLAGQADLQETATPAQLKSAAGKPGLRPFPWPSLQYAFLGMNFRDAHHHAQPNAFFSDLRVRRAVSMAIDRRAMLRNVFDTLGALGHGPFPYTVSTADTAIRVPSYDPTAAAALLDSAGWKPGPDGVRVKNGRRFAVTLLLPGTSSARKSYAVLIQDALRQAGIAVTLDGPAFDVYVDRQSKGAFDLDLEAIGIDPDVGATRQAWGSADMPPAGMNYLSYANPQVDALLDSAVTSFSAPTAAAYARRAYQAIADDAPAVWLYDVESYGIISARFQVPSMAPNRWWQHLADWTVPVNARIDRDRIGLAPPPARP